MIMYGDVIFRGSAKAKIFEFPTNLNLNEDHIVFARALTVDVAFYILNNPVLGIITEESSFATHGANVLRSYYRNKPKSIVWISGIPQSEISPIVGNTIKIDLDGSVECIDGTFVCEIKKTDINNDFTVRYKPLKCKSIVDYNISNNSYFICYWPHRNFNTLTFSVMSKGLSRNMEMLNNKITDIKLDDNGLIWFGNATFTTQLYKLSSDIEFATPILNQQIAVYKKIHERLRSKYSIKDLSIYIEDYFSVFMLFHDTYEMVLVGLYEFLLKNIGNIKSSIFMDNFMYCMADNWILEENLILIKKKNLLSDEVIVPLPSFSIADDIYTTTKRIESYFIEIDEECFFQDNKYLFNFYISFFVAKEWKFITNKILFTRFSTYLKDNNMRTHFDAISKMNIREVINIITS